LVNEIFTARLSGTSAGEWTRPDGGYFTSLNTVPGGARRVAALCREAGLEVTGAGATFPYQKDPEDRNIRVAPSYLSMGDLRTALEILCAAVLLAAAEISGKGGAGDA
jgi:DNA-binding transcriptional MocR family regulator